MDFGPGSAAFALVAWDKKERYGRWSFWRRGTGETMMQHHCRGTERSEPVDSVRKDDKTVVRECRECGAKPSRKIEALYFQHRVDWYERRKK